MFGQVTVARIGHRAKGVGSRFIADAVLSTFAVYAAASAHGPVPSYIPAPLEVYHTGLGWAVFAQDITPMPAGAVFNVVVPGDGFVHVATPEKTAGAESVLDSPQTNDRPEAIVLVTSNWNPAPAENYVHAGQIRWRSGPRDRTPPSTGRAV